LIKVCAEICDEPAGEAVARVEGEMDVVDAPLEIGGGTGSAGAAI
jgi:CO dehydrogenase/acetyl-CoA synthase delta subunit